MNQAAAEFQQLTGHPPGGYAILAGNEPPRPLDAAPPGRTALYDGLGLEPPTRTVAEYAFQLPRELVGNLTRKAVYAVGLFELSGIDAVGADVPDASWVYVALWCAALAGAVRLLRAPVGFTWPVVLLPALLALSHFAAVVLIMGHWYGDRLILPLYPLLVPYAALGLEPLVHWAQSRVERVTIAVLVALALCVFVTVSSRVSDVVILLVFGGVVLAFTTGPATARHAPRMAVLRVYGRADRRLRRDALHRIWRRLRRQSIWR